jgi:hypothetical protein
VRFRTPSAAAIAETKDKEREQGRFKDSSLTALVASVPLVDWTTAHVVNFEFSHLSACIAVNRTGRPIANGEQSLFSPGGKCFDIEKLISSYQ